MDVYAGTMLASSVFVELLDQWVKLDTTIMICHFCGEKYKDNCVVQHLHVPQNSHKYSGPSRSVVRKLSMLSQEGGSWDFVYKYHASIS